MLIVRREAASGTKRRSTRAVYEIGSCGLAARQCGEALPFRYHDWILRLCRAAVRKGSAFPSAY